MSAYVQTMLVRGWRRLVFRWRRVHLYRELVEEIESHRLLKQAENRNAGLTPEAARDLSSRQMGNIAIAQEECRDMWSFVMLASAGLALCRSSVWANPWDLPSSQCYHLRSASAATRPCLVWLTNYWFNRRPILF